MIRRTDSSSPAGLQIYRLHQLLKADAFKDLHTEQQTNLKTDNYNTGDCDLWNNQTLRRMHWSCRIEMWSMEPAQNFP